ncbi:lamin tail domain-containing protein [Paraliomyxa miuraensis]|uniref:lamin tail domain-containing protein n=1 Tax=Paraliomyxa miuraensis TaxID=376150 RepID=UPI0022545F7F|nr:lamin tail domain-containing protein [Paraliomyxa miuraensis]MCX4246313.1 lamin tail domain-containing protein [Paraliomyxa miuraensis]
MSHLRVSSRLLAPLAGLVLASGCPDPDPVPVDTDTETESTTMGPVTVTADGTTTSGVDTTMGGTTLDTTATATMGDTDTDTDTGEPPPPPGETIVCDNVIDPAPAGQVCAVTPGSSTLLLQGTVLAGFDVYENGTVLVDTSDPGNPNGRITCVGCDCGAEPEASTATVVACEQGVISPGLINPHDHITFTLSQPVPHGIERYDHRHEWRLGLNGATELDTFPGSNSSREGVLYGELRMLLGGATSISGSVGGASAQGLLRNLDRVELTEGLSGVDVNYRTFPLGDSNGTMLDAGCDYPFIDGTGNLLADVYMPHIAEGITHEARNEFLCLSGAAGGNDLMEGNTSVIHGIGMRAIDIDLMGDEGAMLVWSPRSNVDLYGITAELTTYRNLGVRMALGTDWTASGSMNVLRELACADSFNQDHLGGAFSDLELWLMSTYWAAVSQGADDQIGLIKAGHVADLAIFDGSGLAAGDTAYRAIIGANVEDVALVLRGGRPLHGDASVIEGLVDPVDVGGCETLDVCGVDKRLCAGLDAGLTSAQITGAVNGASYPLFFCGDPDDEPSCDPARPDEFPNRGGAGDPDGDGLSDSEDNCPGVFNPVRPLDNGVQADSDADGLGDACDRCPLAPGEGCAVPDVFDQDGDGVVDPADNCPYVANGDQADADADGVGDACDVCPMVANPGGTACPVSVYDIKDGTITPGETVVVEDVVVTASSAAAPGFFVQVHPDDAGYQGVEWSGLYVYVGAGFKPAVGDRVDVSGIVNDYFGQIQLDGSGSPPATVLSGGNPLPEPEITTPADVVEGGPLQAELDAVLVMVPGAVVTNPAPPAGPGDMGGCEFEVAGGLRVNDFFYCVSPYPLMGQTYTQITGVLRWANQYTKLEPRELFDYPPSLVSLGQSDAYLLVGSIAAPTIPPLLVQLSAPVLADTPVALGYGDPGIVSGPAQVIVPMGLDSAPVLLDGVSLGTADVTASLDGVMLVASVQVYDDAQARVPTLSPSALAVPLSDMADLTVTLNLPAPAGGQVVDLSIAPGACASVPANVVVPASMLSATFTVTTGACEGDETVTAAIGPATSDAVVSVIDSPVFPNLILAEVYYNHTGTDDQFEWVKIYNGTGAAVNLAGHSLGWGGSNYIYGTLNLAGTIDPGECFVVGGPMGNADSGFPGAAMFDQATDFNPDIQNSGATADGVALFDVPAAMVGAATVPIDAVVYGTNNTNGLIDETGMAAAVDVENAPAADSIRRQADGTWAFEANPAPLACVPFP